MGGVAEFGTQDIGSLAAGPKLVGTSVLPRVANNDRGSKCDIL
jgi:hypothetical protein